MLIIRESANPILKPNKKNSWEGRAVFNGSPAVKDGKTYLTYRALSLPYYSSLIDDKLEVSEIGIAESNDGISFSNRNRFIIPDRPWDKLGCEDPRITEFEGRYYTFYTALSGYPFSADNIKVGLAITDDLKCDGIKCVEEKYLVTPFNAKAMTMFPERINGKIWVALSVNTDLPPSKICLAFFDEVEDVWNKDKWNQWYEDHDRYSLDLARNSKDQIEIGAQPIRTEEGWLLLYSYIKNYHSSEPLFGVEAVLLDLDNPMKVIGRTDSLLLTPEEYYEEIGLVENIVFPSGALSENGIIKLYYGAADTTCCLAYIDEKELLNKMTGKKELVYLNRHSKNPILEPIDNNEWESRATFNPTSIYLDKKVHILYRAMSQDNTSTIGYASSTDGLKIDYRHPEPIYTPREDFEEKKVPNGNSGCEDPRITKFGERIYMIYTAYNGKNPPRVALTSIKEKDFLRKNWNWEKPVLITPPNIDDKDACLLPVMVDGGYFMIHRVGSDIDYSISDSLNFDGETWLEESRWIYPRPGMWDDEKVGVASTPIETERGWVMFYHGVSKDDNVYRVGAILLDKKDPKKVVARLQEPILEPETEYEKFGEVPNVVFPCGAILMGETFFVYYGGADKVTGVATIDKEELLDALEKNVSF